MSDLLTTGATWLAAKLKAAVATSVTYRSGKYSVVLSATFGQTEYEQVDNEGFGIRVHTSDFIITAADLILNGETITPSRGDTIEQTVSGETRTHEVLGIGSGPCFSWSDPHRTIMRIHTKQLRVE